jgi:CRISPR-associated protein (TIGR03986 family)
MATIKAPFNFVPVSKTVFFPDWAKQISHDIPFEDGESGVIELKITAESPVFVRNGYTRKDGEEKNDVFKSFSKIDDRFFIPATSIKGAIRNVLEIMSFGKMRLDKNAMFAQREWDNEPLYPMKREQNRLLCGYLKRDKNNKNNYIIVNCGKPYRIGHKRIDEKIGSPVFENKFSKHKGIDLNEEYKIGDTKFDPKTAVFKYELIKTNPNITSIQNFDLDNEFCNEYKDNRLKFSNTGQYSGRLVLTGQPDKWTWPRPTKLTNNAGKYYEFVFLEPEDSESIPFSEEQFNHFKFIYMESPEWERAKKRLEDEGIPVFFRKKPNGDIRDLGLAFLYKLPYDYSPFDTLEEKHKNETDPDLADCIFGFTNLKHRETKETKALKGRVQFSPAFAKNAEPDKDVVLTLNSPKASYYPLYIQQSGQNGYKTYNDGVIAGWKRYMVRKNIWGYKTETECNPTLDTIIHPVKAGAVFTGKIRFHNLRKVELGALLSALTFHNSNECHHQLGQGKPYGFGKVKLEICGIKLSSNQNVEQIELMEQFEEQMLKEIKKWNETDQIRELFTMAKQEVDVDDVFEYMHMDNDRTKNEFLKAKQFNEFLNNYSVLTNAQFTPVSLVKAKYDRLIKESIALKEQAKELTKQSDELIEQSKYEDATKLLGDATELLNEVKKKDDAKNLFPDKNEHQDILYETSQILKRIEDNKKKIEKSKQGLLFLEEKYPAGVNEGKYKVNDFKGGEKRIDQWMKQEKVQVLPNEQWAILYSFISRLIQKSDKKELKNWKDCNSHFWKKLAGYVGEEKAKEWFNELIK